MRKEGKREVDKTKLDSKIFEWAFGSFQIDILHSQFCFISFVIECAFDIFPYMY